jgi:hypothetical protein
MVTPEVEARVGRLALSEMIERGEELRKADESVILLTEALRATQRTFDKVMDPGWQVIEDLLANTRDVSDEALRRQKDRFRADLLAAIQAHDPNFDDPWYAEAFMIVKRTYEEQDESD